MAAFARIEDIEVWIVSRQSVGQIYRLTSGGPARRDFGFCNQIRRSSVSVMSNIAEGFGRHSDKEFARFLDIARGSAIETQSLLYVGLDVGYLSQSDFNRLAKTESQIIGQITALCKYLRQKTKD